MKAVQAELNDCLRCANKLQELQAEKRDYQNRIVDSLYSQEVYKRRIKICNYVIIGILALIGIIAMSFSHDEDSGQLLAAIITLSIVLAVAIGLRIKFKAELKSEKDSEKAVTDSSRAAIKDIDEQLAALLGDALDRKLFEIIPPCYFYPSAIQYIISVFNRRLADNMKEALNLLEAEIQRSHTLRRQNEFNEALLRGIQELTDAVDANTYFTTQKQ